MPVTLKLEPAPAAIAAPSTVNPQDALDANETIIQAPAFELSSLPTLSGQDSEMIGTILAIVLGLYVVKVILSVLPRVVLIGIGACVVYAFLR